VTDGWAWDPWGDVPGCAIEPLADGQFVQRLFWIAVGARIAIIVALAVLTGTFSNLSRDSVAYDHEGAIKAAQYAAGEIRWSNWVDEGWKEYGGVIYLLFGPQQWLIQLINALLSGVGTVLVYRSSLLAFQDQSVAKATALVWAVFPSVVYYTSLPLKEAPAVFGILCIVLGTLRLIVRAREPKWIWIALGMAIMTSLRVYLVPILSGCVLTCILFSRARLGTSGLVQAGLILGCVGGMGYVLVRQHELALGDYAAFEYYDVNRVNAVRSSLTRGNARMYASRDEAAFSEDWLDNGWKVLKGIAFFLFSVNPTQITRDRQLAALPELAFFLYCLPYLLRGVIHGWRVRPKRILPLILIGAAIIAVYGSATTNAGAMYRWRCQALPFLIMIIVYGAAVGRRGLMFKLIQRFRPRLAWR
jgi:hypothetical protein